MKITIFNNKRKIAFRLVVPFLTVIGLNLLGDNSFLIMLGVFVVGVIFNTLVSINSMD